MRVLPLVFAASIALLAAGCDSEPPAPEVDGGPPVDAYVPPGVDANLPPMDTGVCVPRIEICGDRMDQDCDGRDTSCGDSDRDGVQACREGDDLTMCDCNDARADVRPARGGLPGAPELCDGLDNDCNGRIDESAECCEGCASLGAERERADVCLEDGTCDCSTEPGTGPCASGQTCCLSGCTDTDTDFDNCGGCRAMCTVQADSCVGGSCTCGSMGMTCDFTTMCVSGRCGG